MLKVIQTKWTAFWLLCLIAGLIAIVRQTQLRVTLPASELRLNSPHSLIWNPITKILAQTGDDPYCFPEVPANSVPLVAVEFEFGAPTTNEPFYLYPTPAYLPDASISDASVVQSRPQPRPDGFRVRFDLPEVHLPRLDLPDVPGSHYTLKSATYVSAYASTSNPTFMLLVGTLISALALLLWNCLGTWISRLLALEILCMIGLAGLKIWIARGLHLTVFCYAFHDDTLYLTQGHSIANGDWLGAFTSTTLAKGPVFPIFIALVQLTRISFIVAEAGLHAVACLVFVEALRPLVRSAGLRLTLLAVLLFDPHTFSTQVVAQVLRSGIQPALTLFALAGFIGLLTRATSRPLALLPWSLLAGVALPLFWYCREEGPWLLPTLVLLVSSTVWIAIRSAHPGCLWRLSLLALPVAAMLAAQTLLHAVNLRYYDAPITIEVKDGAYADAYAALLRITPKDWILGVPVTQDARLSAYQVSPAFAQLRPYLEGEVCAGWAKLGWEGIDHPRAQKEFRGWFQWALRDAASHAGYYENAGAANRYWAAVAREINEACDAGRIPAGPRRSGFLPRWDASLWPVLWHSIHKTLAVVVEFSDFRPQGWPSSGDARQVSFFSRMLHEPAIMERLPANPRTHVMIGLFHFYSTLGAAATIAAVLSTLALAVRTFRRREWLLPVLILVSLLGGAFALTLIIALVDATSFSAAHAIYVSPATPLWLTAVVLAPTWALRAWQIRLPSVSRPRIEIRSFLELRMMRCLTRPILWFAPLVIVGLVFALLRWQETSQQISGEEVSFSLLHNMSWDQHRAELNRTGDDPYGVLLLPQTSIPLLEVQIYFRGLYFDRQGFFCAFGRSVRDAENFIDPNSISNATIIRGPDNRFAALWTFTGSKTLRLDLPDFQDHPLQIESIELRTRYCWLGSKTLVATALSFVAAGLCLIMHLSGLRRRST